MNNKFNYNPKAYENIPRDFMGNPILVGDTVVVCERTYSKTPYMVYGQVKKVETTTNKKGDAIKSFTVHIYPTGESDGTTGFKTGAFLDDYDSIEEMYEVWGHPDEEESWDAYTFNSKSFINIIKVK
jgi:hypothetical protein